MIKKYACIFALSLFLIFPWPVKTYAVWWATEFTQILNNIELMGVDLGTWQIVAQQLEQLANEAEMLEYEYKNLLSLVENPMAEINSLESLNEIIQKGQVISYAAGNVEARYAELNPGFKEYTATIMPPPAWEQKYTEWGERNKDNIAAVLKSAGLEEETIFNEKDRLETLKEMSRSAEGRKEVIQAGNLIAAEEVESLQRLRKLVADSSQLQANYMAKQQDSEDVHRAQWRRIMADGPTDTPPLGTALKNGKTILNDFHPQQ